MGNGWIRRAWQGFRGRPWLRRLTLALAAGAVSLGGLAWTLRQPHFSAWLTRAVDAKLREETGLSFSAESIQVHPLEGRVVLHGVAIGGDLARVARLEALVSPLSLLGPRPHVRRLLLEEPTLRLDAGRLAQIRLKPTPPAAKPLEFLLDELSIQKGFLLVREPAWGLPSASSTFEAAGTGTGPGSLRIDLKAPAVALGTAPHRLQGSFGARFQMSPRLLLLQDAVLDLGRSRLEGGCYLDRGTEALEGKAKVRLLLAELGPLAPAPARQAGGTLALEGTFARTEGLLQWKAALSGTGLQLAPGPVQPGALKAALRGDLKDVDLQSFRWESAQGVLTASGRLGRTRGVDLSFQTEALDLGPLATFTRIPLLRGAVLTAQGALKLPMDQRGAPRFETASAALQGRIGSASAPAVGAVDLEVASGAFHLRQLDLRLPSLDLQAQGQGLLDPQGLRTLAAGGNPLRAFSATGRARTEAARVAEVLFGWGIGLDETRTDPGGRPQEVLAPFPMSGAVSAQAEVRWSVREGLALDGSAEVTDPGWYQARGDRMTASVAIRGDELRVRDIALEKGAGHGSGDIWLTWADLAPGASAMDMCFRAWDLPIEEGLKAADVGDLEIRGTGSGWARLHGPYERIVLDAEAQADDADVYGIRIPAFQGDLTLDLESYQLVVPHFQVAGRRADLGLQGDPPSGPLALEGRLMMDINAERWDVTARGFVDSTHLGLSGPRFQAFADARLEGPWTRPLGPEEVPNGRVALTGGRLFLGEQSLEGLEASLVVQDGDLRAELGWAGHPERAFTLRGFQDGAALLFAADLQLSPQSAPTGLTARMLTQDVLQDADLALSARGAWRETGLAWQGTLAHLKADFDGFTLQASRPGRLEGDAQAAALDLDLDGRTPGAQLPSASLSLTGNLPLSATGPLGLKATGHANLQDAKGILDDLLKLDPYSLLADLKVSGRAELDMGIVGTFQRPALEGTLGLRQGNLQILSYPQGVEDLDLTLHFQDRDLILKPEAPLTGSLAQGALAIWGRATWQQGGLQDYDLEASLEDFQFRDIPVGFELQGSLEARLKGNDREGGLLKGTLLGQRAAYRADIRLTDLILSRSLGVSGLSSGVDPGDPLSRIALDLDLRLRDSWLFDTNLLKMQGTLGGTFKVLGTLAHPGLRGRMDIVPGGRLTNLLPAGDVILESGAIDFTDPQFLNPVINLRGRVDVPPYVVSLALNGSLDQLSVVPTSTPSLRQDEVVAILIDPTVAQDIGATSVSSSQAAISHGLASTGTGLLTSLALANFQEGLRKTFNLDRVNVAFRTGAAGTAETTITAGKSFEIFRRRVPIVATYRRAGDYTIVSGQVEWRFGDFVLQLGLSSDEPGKLNPAGEVRYTWSVR